MRNRDRDHVREDRGNSNWDGNRDGGNKSYVWGETYGLSPSFLEGLNISPPLVSRVFVANVSVNLQVLAIIDFCLCCSLTTRSLIRNCAKCSNSREKCGILTFQWMLMENRVGSRWSNLIIRSNPYKQSVSFSLI